MRVVFALIAGLVVSLFPNTVFSAEILVIQSYHKEYAWDKAYSKALTEILGSQNNLTFVHMDTKRIPKEQFQKSADAVWDEYLRVKPDYVIVGDDNALKYLGHRLAQKKTPTVFLGINNKPGAYFDDGQVPPNIGGVLERPLLVRNIYYLKKILPNPKRVLLLFDDGITSQAAFKRNTTSNQSISGVKYDVAFIGEEKKWHETVKTAKAKGYDAIFVGLYHTLRDTNGKHVAASQILEWTNKNSNLPLFSFWSFSVGPNKTAGGILLDGYEQGLAAATLLTRMKNGKKARIITGEKGVFMYSKSQLDRWKIKLPPDIISQAELVD